MPMENNVHSPGKTTGILAAAPEHTLWILVVLHILVISASNYLVQLPFTLFGFHVTWGAFTFPLVYVATDLTVRVYGATLARRIIARVMLPALLVSYAISVMFHEGTFQGLGTLTEFNLFVARIAFASFSAYMAGQLLDVTVFNRLRRLKAWWVAPTASSFIGNALDTVVFFAVAFYNSTDAFMATHWVEIAWVDFGFKMLISGVLMLPLYGVILSTLQRHITMAPAQKAPSLNNI